MPPRIYNCSLLTTKKYNPTSTEPSELTAGLMSRPDKPRYSFRGFLRDIRNFNEATDAMNKAKALFKLLGGIYNAGCFRAVFKVLKEEMTWWEWVKTGIIAVAQIMVCFATDGVAFVAEAALTIMSAESLIEDSIKADKVCRK